MTQLVHASRLSIYLGHAHQYHHHPLATEIVDRARKAGLAGASVFEGIEGFGHSHSIHDMPTWGVTEHTPVTVHIIDTPARIDAFLPQLHDISDNCVIARDDVDVPASMLAADRSQ